MTSLQSQYLLGQPVTQHRHISSPRPLHPGTSTEKPDRDSKRNSIKCPRSPTNIGTDSQKPSPWKRLTRQTSLLWRSTETSASTCKGPMVLQSKGLGPAKLEASLVQWWIKIHAAEKKWLYTCLQMPEWEVSKGTASLRSTISAVEVWWCGVPYHTLKNSTGAHPRQL